jgi:integrase
MAANLLDAEDGRFPLNHESIFTGDARSTCPTLGSILVKKADYHEKNRERRWYFNCLNQKRECTAAWGLDLPMNQITDEHVRTLITHLKKKNNPNTIADKIKRLRRIFRDEIKAGRYKGVNPFDLITVSRQPVSRVRLTLEELKKIESVALSGRAENIRDMFMFSFYMQGMRFENCLKFKKEDAREEITYRMNKGRKIREIDPSEQLQGLVGRYLSVRPGNPYLFPFLTKESADRWKWDEQKASWNTVVNETLKLIAIRAGVDRPVTFHSARHTFATLLKKFQAAQGESNIYVIQQALGHSDIKTTQAYLDSLDDDIVNEQVNRMFVALQRKNPDPRAFTSLTYFLT